MAAILPRAVGGAWPLRPVHAAVMQRFHPKPLGQPAPLKRNLTTQTLDIIKATLPAVGEAGPAFTAHFYKRMFGAHPELLNTFNIANQRQGKQQKALFSAVAACAVNVLEHGTLPVDLIEGVNHKHCALDVKPEQYNVVGEHILGTITDLLDPGQEVLDAWGALYGDLADYCIKREEALYQATESKPGGWRGGRPFKVVEKTVESETITKFSFAPMDGKPICSHSPGQYTTIWLHPEEWKNRQPRHYSLISKPGSDTYSIAVKKEPMGLVSAHLHDRVAVGDEVQLSAPYGNFSIAGCERLWTNDPSAPVVMMSAGVGITPMLGMLGTMKSGSTAQSRPVIWLHAAKNSKEHAFKDYVTGLTSAVHPDDVTRRVWYEFPLADDKAGQGNRCAFHYEGRMDLSKVTKLLPLDNSHAQYFFCGPVPFMKSVAAQLEQLGADRNSLHFETFGPADDILS